MFAFEAYYKALKEGPSDRTRRIACRDPYYAVLYAWEVDKHPRKDTRRAACKDPGEAQLYAFMVDKHPRKDTRRAACRDPHYAYYYAIEIDRKPTKETWEAVRNTEYERDYIKHFDTSREELDDIFNVKFRKLRDFLECFI